MQEDIIDEISDLMNAATAVYTKCEILLEAFRRKFDSSNTITRSEARKIKSIMEASSTTITKYVAVLLESDTRVIHVIEEVNLNDMQVIEFRNSCYFTATKAAWIIGASLLELSSELEKLSKVKNKKACLEGGQRILNQWNDISTRELRKLKARATIECRRAMRNESERRQQWRRQAAQKVGRYATAKWSPPAKMRVWLSLFKQAGMEMSEDTLTRKIKKNIYVKSPDSTRGRLILDITTLPKSMQSDTFWNSVSITTPGD